MLSRFFKSIALCSWVVIGFFGAQLALAYAVGVFIKLGIMHASDLDKPLPQLVFIAVAYSLAFGIIVWAPRLFKPLNEWQAELGVNKRPQFKKLILSIPAYGVYIILTFACSLAVQSLWHGFNANQTQPVGFTHLANGFEYAMAFVALVVVAPIAEELLFRGYLFGRLRTQSGFWPSMVVTSVLFGLVHLQWNVGVDVFALSLVLCFLREKTGTIWAGIVLHMIKNVVAFTLLFLHPDILKNLL
jgi:membrane protease YdiL (CAAX protease family)